MTVRGILFSSEMVCALLHGCKTQTRRIPTRLWEKVEVGDLFYVREKHRFAPMTAWNAPKRLKPGNNHIAAYYAAGWERSIPRWRPSIHMPRWASRITLRVTEVVRENIQNIQYDDAVDEGVRRREANGEYKFSGPGGFWWGCPRYAFQDLWDGLHGHKPGESWVNNPEVIALTFEVISQNVDEYLKSGGGGDDG